MRPKAAWIAHGNAPFARSQRLDAFTGKTTPNADVWEWFTCSGGKGTDEGHWIALDGFRRVYVTGSTTSADLPGANTRRRGRHRDRG